MHSARRSPRGRRALASGVGLVVLVIRRDYGRREDERSGKERERKRERGEKGRIAKGISESAKERRARSARLTPSVSRRGPLVHSDSTRLDSIRLALASGRPVAGTLAHSPGSSRSLAGVRCTALSVTAANCIPWVLSFALTPVSLTYGLRVANGQQCGTKDDIGVR